MPEMHAKDTPNVKWVISIKHLGEIRIEDSSSVSTSSMLLSRGLNFDLKHRLMSDFRGL